MDTLVETLVLHEDGTQTIEYLEGFAEAYPPIEDPEDLNTIDDLFDILGILLGVDENE